MKKSTCLIFNLLPIIMLASCTTMPQPEPSPRIRENIDSQWKFILADPAGAEKPDYDDGSWRTLNLPHDWAIEGDFSADNPSGYAGGALPGGVGWYRKTIEVDSVDLADGAKIYIDFDGIYMLSNVYVNGISTGIRPYGYISFRRDITPLLHQGKNVIAVRVDNAEQPNSRWYSGCGIYRHVWLVKTNAIHVDQWGTYVTTPEINEHSATINIATRVRNTTSQQHEIAIRHYILNKDGETAAYTEGIMNIERDTTHELSHQAVLTNPIRWSIENPYLYTVRTQIVKQGSVIDSYDTPLGIRTYRFDAQKGFYLNDKPVKIKGVCMHHDLGCLGAAVNTRAIERQLEILKEMGCNAYRCSHNPPAPEVLDLCDRMGFIVMDEALDMWKRPKTRYDYARFFNEWHERDITDLVMRDRNHPSIFIWSIGNEVREQWTHEQSDNLSLEDANMPLNLIKNASSLVGKGEVLSNNSLLTRHLCDIVKRLDSRPITTGNDEPNPGNHLFRACSLDIIGYNYHIDWFDSVPGWFPETPFIATESASALMTRGYYEQPSDSFMPRPIRWDIPYTNDSYSCSSYDHVHAPWGSTHERNWHMVKERDYVSGTFIWTGFDYIGEPTPYTFPARSSYFGIVDLAGFPKDIYYMYKSEWSNDTVLHLFPHWNHRPGETIDMCCYFNHADEVELWVNEVSQGIRTKREGQFHAMWRVTYQPGEVRVVSRSNGQEVATKTIRTAGKPAQIRLTPDRSTIQADGRDLSFVTVEIVDEQGNLCPLADDLVTFHINGNAFIAGVDNGSPYSMERFKSNQRKAFYGKCLVVLQNNGTRGASTLTATSANLTSAQATIIAE